MRGDLFDIDLCWLLPATAATSPSRDFALSSPVMLAHRHFAWTALAISALGTTLPAQVFQEVQAPLGIQGITPTPSSFGRGVCVADFDDDGDVDVVFAGAVGTPLRMFRNDGGFAFTDVSAGSGLGLTDQALCFAVADIDNDGDTDLYIGNKMSRCQLFLNDGTGVFTLSAPRGLTHTTINYSASFGDFDRDGWIDLYVGNYTTPAGFTAANNLYRNDGTGGFVDVTVSSGTAGNASTFAAPFFDYDEDGWPDLIDVNDKTNGGTNEVYRNLGDGTFAAAGAQIAANNAIYGMGIDFADAFNDGGVDYYCSDRPLDHLFQVWNPATGSYDDATHTYGMPGGGVGWAVNWLDYDNDGWQDLHVVQAHWPNLLFHNPGQAAGVGAWWPEVAATAGLDQVWRQYAAAIADFDDDGRLDILQMFPSALNLQAPSGLSLHRNTAATGNWLKFRIRGTVGNRDGLGARVELQAGGMTQRQWRRSGVGFLSHSDPRLHFGLGNSTAAARVTVTWPSGQVQHLTNVAANQIVDLVEPSLRLQGPAMVGGTTALELSIPGDEGLLHFMLLAFSDTPPVALSNGQVIPISPDNLTIYALDLGNAILPNSYGLLDATGTATSPLIIPPLPWLLGVTLYATAVTMDTPAFPFFRTVFPTALPITVQ
ncbi:MAG: hypothetical protein ACI89X_003862 [Planctomycetota bacterium]|jgi:hypothetical protein